MRDQKRTGSECRLRAECSPFGCSLSRGKKAEEDETIGDYPVKTIMADPKTSRDVAVTTQFLAKNLSALGIEMEPWHYAVAVVIAVLLLAAIAFGMWKCGAFKSKYAEDAAQKEAELNFAKRASASVQG